MSSKRNGIDSTLFPPLSLYTSLPLNARHNRPPCIPAIHLLYPCINRSIYYIINIIFVHIACELSHAPTIVAYNDI